MAFSTISFLAIAGSALPPDKIGTGIGYFSLGQGRHTGYCADSGFGTGVGHRV